MNFRRKHMHVVPSFNDIPFPIRKQVRNVIVAENRERFQFNKICYAFEYGQYTEKWQVGHIVMANTQNNKNNEKNKYSSFQQFRIVSNNGEMVKLQNVKRDNHCPEVSLEILKKHFDYPFARTCHSWQGMTCDDILVIYGTHHLYKGIDWDFTADSRTSKFDNVWHILPPEKEDEMLNLREFLQQKIDGYIQQDLDRGFVLDMTKYIDVAWIELECRRSEWKCHYCSENIFLGWTIDRLNNGLPHYRYNCHLCCLSCNRLKK